MNGIGSRLRRRVALGAVTVGSLAAAGLSAQSLTVYGTVGGESNSTSIQLLGATARWGGLGLQPEVGLQGYHLNYDAGTSNGDVWAVLPSAGASFRMPAGQVGARVGYSFQSDGGGISSIGGFGGSSGVVAMAQGNYWGPGPELQGIVSHNFGAHYLWSNAQALVPVLPLPPGKLSAGGEATWEGSTQSGGGHSTAILLGPIVKWSTGRNFSVNAGAGWMHRNGGGDDGWYLHVGAVKYGMSLF